jgi:hypothetical protein
MNPPTTELPVSPERIGSAAQQEVRCAVRFPLSLPVVLSTVEEEFSAATVNVSSLRTGKSLLERRLDSHYACREVSSAPHAMYWFIAADVWYAVTQVRFSTILRRQLMSTDLQISNSMDTYGRH